MKYCFIVAIFALSTYSIKPNPFAYTLSALDPKQGIVRATLEKSTAVIQKKGRTSATSSSYTISNAKSLVRIKIGDAVFQSYSDKSTALLAPEDYISLYKLSSDRTSRSFTINTDGTTNTALIPVTFTPTHVQINKITLAKGLTPGEYAFVDRSTTTADNSITVWTFGID